MASFFIDKELLRPGVVLFTRRGPVSFSDDEVEEIFRSSQGLRDSGRRPFVPYEHRNDAKPVLLSQEDRASELTKYNTGFGDKYFRKPDGSLWARLEIRDPKAAEDIKNGLHEFVSPEIVHAFPADGKVWRNVITHIALTHQPVWKDQAPFHVPPGWVGDDGAVSPVAARMSLLSGDLRFSLEEAAPPEETAEVLRLGYRIPGGAAATGVWVGDGYHERHVPKAVLSGMGDDDRRELLRKLAARHGRRLPRDFAGLVPRGEASPFNPVATEIPASHVGLHDALPPFERAHPAGEPYLVWEDPEDGKTHLVSGHDRFRGAANTPDARVSVVRVPGGTPYEARGGALMAHLLGGTAHPHDLAEFFHDGADRDELDRALSDGGHVPDRGLLHHAWGLSLRPDPRPRPAATRAADDGTSGKQGEAAASLFEHEPGYDPGEHRWQHWLQSEFADPEARARFASAHGTRRPSTHDDFLARKGAFEQERLSHGGEVMFDYESMTEPKAEEKEGKPKEEPKGEPKDKGEDKGEKKSPFEKKAEPKAGGKLDHFEENLKMLKDDFNVALPSDTDEKNFQEKLHGVLNAMKHVGAQGAASGAELRPEGAGGGMQYSLADAQKDIESLRKDNETLKGELSKRDKENMALAEVTNKQQLSLIRTDLEKHQRAGHCTKAEVDDWLTRILAVMGQHRFSVLAPAESVEMVGIFAEIKQMKKSPDGTYTDGKAAPGGDVNLVPAGETTSDRLSLTGAGTEPSADERAKVEASRQYFKDHVWSQLGIDEPSTNGKK